MTEELGVIAERVDNTGRWGENDQLGTLNFIDNSVRLAALAEVRRGEAHSIGRDLDFVVSRGNPRPAINVLIDVNDNDHTVRDELTIAPHGLASTHVDAVGHCFLDGELYNRRPARSALSEHGLEFGSIMSQKDGVLTRGVLLDVAAARGVARRVRGGDAIFVRVGTALGEDPVFSVEGEMIRAGLGIECLEWIHARDIAIYSGDCVDVFPSPFPDYPDYLHQIALGRMGMAFLDCPDIERLGILCHREKRSTFLLTYAPLRVPYGTGSPVNPLVIF